MKNLLKITVSLLFLMSTFVQADQVILDDLIVDGSACIGFDCVNGESFGFDTLRLKENNLRIKAQDTSSSASFPSNDWQITFNDSSNGGANKFSIDDIDGGRTPFTIEAGAPSHSLYVDDGGRIGLGTSTPVVELHIKDGDSPTLRLEQDGSSGFTPQTWDVAGNEANFFIRDATNGSTLPFRIFPGAPSNALRIEATGNVRIGESITTPLTVGGAGNAFLYVESTDNDFVHINMKTDSENRKIIARGDDDAKKSQIVFRDGEILLAGTTDSGSGLYLTVNSTGISVNGSISTTADGEVHPDYVFTRDYDLMALTELRSFIEIYHHLPGVPSASEVAINGINMTKMQMTLLKKIEELTLYTLHQQDIIESLQSKLIN